MTTPCLPAEWYPQDGVLLVWPHADTDWAPILPRVEPVFDTLVQSIAAREIAVVVAYSADHEQYLQQRFARLALPPNRVRTVVAPSNDTWARDFGPLGVLRNRQVELLNYRFNGWGGKYAHQHDDQLVARLGTAGVFTCPLRERDLILEGGGIDSDGAGALLTTTTCLLSAARDNLSREQWETELQENFGVTTVHWLENAWLDGDDTDGHIDNLARFTDPQTIVYAACHDRRDPHFEPLGALRVELEQLRRADGTPYQLIPLPLPQAVHSLRDGRRLPASYVNFLIINDAVLVPAFGDAADVLVRERLQQCFPQHAMVSIDSRPLVEQNGGIHCLTMQLTRGTLSHD